MSDTANATCGLINGWRAIFRCSHLGPDTSVSEEGA